MIGRNLPDWGESLHCNARSGQEVSKEIAVLVKVGTCELGGGGIRVLNRDTDEVVFQANDMSHPQGFLFFDDARILISGHLNGSVHAWHLSLFRTHVERRTNQSSKLGDASLRRLASRQCLSNAKVDYLDDRFAIVGEYKHVRGLEVTMDNVFVVSC